MSEKSGGELVQMLTIAEGEGLKDLGNVHKLVFFLLFKSSLFIIFQFV